MRTALILENDAVVARCLANVLSGAGWSVLMAGTASQAFTMGRLFEVDLLIADVVLRDGTGPDAARRIKAVCPAAEVLYTSEYSRSRMRMSLPADDDFAFLQTPFANADLLEAVEHLVSDDSLEPDEMHVLAATA